MKANEDLLTKEQIKEAKAAIKSLLKLRDKIDFLEKIEDMDGHTDGLAYDAAQAVLELGDNIYGLQSIIERIENYGNNPNNTHDNESKHHRHQQHHRQLEHDRQV